MNDISQKTDEDKGVVNTLGKKSFGDYKPAMNYFNGLARELRVSTWSNIKSIRKNYHTRGDDESHEE